MLRMHWEEVLGGRVLLGQIEGHCGRRFWKFGTANEGLRILQTGVTEGLWGPNETRSMAEEISARLSFDPDDLAGRLCQLDVTSIRVRCEFSVEANQTHVWMRASNRRLHIGPLPTLTMAVEVLEAQRLRGVLNTGDCIAALQAVLAAGVVDTVGDDLYYEFVPRVVARSMRNERDVHYSLSGLM